jgi:uncharacterized protein (TIRG00374 family)
MDADFSEISHALEQSNLGWITGALLLKLLTLFIHEFRLWLALNHPRPVIRRTMTIGFASGALNLVLPGRAGDIAAIAMLQRFCKLSPGVAAHAVGMASFFEAAVFGLMLIGVFGFGATQWQTALGVFEHTRALTWISTITLSGIVFVVIIAIIGNRLAPQAEEAETTDNGFSIRDFLSDAFRQTGKALSSPTYLVLNIVIAFVEVWGMIFAFSMGFWALGIDIPTPWTAAAVMLGASALASIILPPTYGAGPAAAAVFILSLFGVPQSVALAYSAVWWLISQLPCAMIGVPCIWLLRKSE